MTPTARRTTARRRRLAAAVALGLLAPLPILATTTTSASAVTKSTVVTFDRCDVRTTANDPSSRVGPVFTWKPTMTFDLTTPVRIKENVTGRVTLSDFPASKIPVSIPKHSNTYYTGYLESSLGGTFDYGKSVAAPHVLGQPMPLGESEQDFWFTKPGLVNLFASEFSMNVEGYDGPNNTGTWRRYYVKCDKPVTPTVVASVPTWDPAAKAAVSLSAPSVVQGSTLRVNGTGFRPDESVAVWIDGKKVADKATSLIGAMSHSWTAPAFAVPGAHQVQLVSNISAKSVTRKFVVTPARAKASLKPSKVKRGKKTTVTGSRFKPGEKVSIVVTRTSGGKGLKSKKIGTVKASSTGTVKKKFKVVKKFGKGKHKVTLTGTPSGRAATVKLTVKK